MSIPLDFCARKLAEEHHNLIYGYAYEHHLDLDDYYDILAIALCKAAGKYRNETGSVFSTLAYTCMRNAVRDNVRMIKKRSAIPTEKCVSLYATIKDGDNCKDVELIEFIPDKKNDIDKVESKIGVEQLLSVQNDENKQILSCLMKGLTWDNTAKEVRCSKKDISKAINSARSFFNN